MVFAVWIGAGVFVWAALMLVAVSRGQAVAAREAIEMSARVCALMEERSGACRPPEQ